MMEGMGTEGVVIGRKALGVGRGVRFDGRAIRLIATPSSTLTMAMRIDE